jgi:hydroxyacylglutathione hydrolase
MIVQQIIDPKLAHHAYLLGCQQTGQAILIDPQRDIERYLAIAKQAGLTIVAAADTHIHADYLSGLRQLAAIPGIKIYASGEGGSDWQYEWLINSFYDYQLLKHNDKITIGTIRLDVNHTPGHTPEHLTYLVTDLAANPEQPIGLISGDFVFAGDVGRPDLLERAAKQSGTMIQSAKELFNSIQAFKRLAPSLTLWPGHGSGSVCGKSLSVMPVSTVGHELETNPSIKAANDSDQFVNYIITGQPEPPAYFARMKKENKEGPALLTDRPKPRAVLADEIEALLSKPKYILVDTRSWGEYQDAHIAGVLFAPLDKTFTMTMGSFVEADQQICLIIEPNQLEEAITDCLRIGLDTVAAYITPDQLSEFFAWKEPPVRSQMITVKTLLDRISQPDLIVLDVRKASELIETGRIEGVYNIAHTQLLHRHTELPRDKHIHVLCQAGERSRLAYGFLERLGYTVTFVDGGMAAWKGLRYPVLIS